MCKLGSGSDPPETNCGLSRLAGFVLFFLLLARRWFPIVQERDRVRSTQPVDSSVPASGVMVFWCSGADTAA